jgi:hypothetical protein
MWMVFSLLLACPVKPSPDLPNDRSSEAGPDSEGKTQHASRILDLRAACSQEVNWFSRRSPDAPTPSRPASHRPYVPAAPAPIVDAESSPGELPHAPVFGAMDVNIARVAVKDTCITDLPPEAQRRIAVIKGECERQMAELESARRSCAAEIARLHLEQAEVAKQRDLDRRAMAAVRSFMQKQVAELDAAKMENADLAATLAATRARVDALEAERDGRLQSSDPETASVRAGELQRQLVMMECSVRELAKELVEERSARQLAESEVEKLREQEPAPRVEIARANAGWLGRLCRGRF